MKKDFAAAFSKALDAYHDSGLKTKVEGEIDSLSEIDEDSMVKTLVPILIANRLRDSTCKSSAALRAALCAAYISRPYRTANASLITRPREERERESERASLSAERHFKLYMKSLSGRPSRDQSVHRAVPAAPRSLPHRKAAGIASEHVARNVEQPLTPHRAKCFLCGPEERGMAAELGLLERRPAGRSEICEWNNITTIAVWKKSTTDSNRDGVYHRPLELAQQIKAAELARFEQGWSRAPSFASRRQATNGSTWLEHSQNFGVRHPFLGEPSESEMHLVFVPPPSLNTPLRSSAPSLRATVFSGTPFGVELIRRAARARGTSPCRDSYYSPAVICAYWYELYENRKEIGAALTTPREDESEEAMRVFQVARRLGGWRREMGMEDVLCVRHLTLELGRRGPRLRAVSAGWHPIPLASPADVAIKFAVFARLTPTGLGITPAPCACTSANVHARTFRNVRQVVCLSVHVYTERPAPHTDAYMPPLPHRLSRPTNGSRWRRKISACVGRKVVGFGIPSHSSRIARTASRSTRSPWRRGWSGGGSGGRSGGGELWERWREREQERRRRFTGATATGYESGGRSGGDGLWEPLYLDAPQYFGN
ncbi:hypothetical protein GGX14DRAFT_397417 [Mycena pura]|uniref:Uncharacterized protein n=1 Tax=Mycena pura TaxID=153505 RepID=A0AAD6V934_9AGAR|nr:hypothetical protein GGX14DRAFT_397417 [Mycena pura]